MSNQPGPMGWGLPDYTEQQRHSEEKQAFEALANLVPKRLMRQPAKQVLNKKLLDQIHADIKASGFDDGFSFRFLYKAVMRETPGWLAQLIGSCFQPGTLIRMADGSHKPIQDIRVFDKVLTAEGNVGYVTATMGREADELLYSVKLWGHKAVEMTGEHPLLTQRGYVKASELRLDDFVAVPKYLPQQTTVLQTAAYALRNGQAIRRSRRIAVSSRSTCIGPVGSTRQDIPVYNTIPDLIALDSRFGRLCGLYLAEGDAGENKIVFTFNIDERDTLARETIELWRALFDVEAVLTTPTKQVRKNGKKVPVITTCKVTVHSTIWAVVFKNLLGTGAGRKSLPPDLASGPKEFLVAMVDGWIAGDGHEKTETTTQGTTVSRALALDMHAICNAIGMLPSLTSASPKVGKGVKTRQPRFDVYLRDPQKAMCCTETETHVWRKVRELSSRVYRGRVHNFEVHGDNSYVAEGLGVHNCVASGDMRTTVYRMLAEVFLLNDPEQLPGIDIDGLDSMAFFAPFSYRAGRREAGINGNSDGSLCIPHIRGKMKFGHLPCSAKGLQSDTFPEPQNQRLYKEWGANNRLMDQFLEEAGKYKLLESEPVKQPEDSSTLICDHFKPHNICSMWGFKSSKQLDCRGTNGKPIFQWTRSREPWAHNMSVVGYFTIRGNRYAEIENSWANYHNGNQTFLVAEDEYAKWLRDAECQSVGEIDMDDNAPAFPE